MLLLVLGADGIVYVIFGIAERYIDTEIYEVFVAGKIARVLGSHAG